LYRGPLLPGFYEPWAVAERERLEDAAASALRRLIALLESQKDYDRAIDYAHRALRADPLREEPYRALMRLYVAAGRPADALRSYRELERVFSEELDEAPSAATRALAAQLAAAARLHDNPPPAAQPRRAAAPPPSPEPSTVARLPLAPTRFLRTRAAR
jgi:DNA-binding SARP family transcriptional activator